METMGTVDYQGWVASKQADHIAGEKEHFLKTLGLAGKLAASENPLDRKMATDMLTAAGHVIDPDTIVAFCKEADHRMGGVRMPEQMAAKSEDAKFTEIKAAGRKKISGLWGKMKDMQNEVRKFILQRGNPRA